MKIIILGSGSIGQRHLSNALELMPNIDVTVVSRNKSKADFHENVKVVHTIAACFENKVQFDAAIVATPTSLHVENCIELIQYGIKKIYVEKPVAHNLDAIDELVALTIAEQVQVFVGYDLRFDLGLNKVKALLAEKVIGNTISVQAEVGQYLPDWRKGTNHKEGMSAKISLGGGVMLDLIHEFDYLSWLLGPYQTIFGLNKKSEALDIETEAISVNIFETTSGILGTLSLDYLQKDLNRNAKFIGDFGTIIWDYPTSEVKWKTHTEETWNTFSYTEVSRNDRFKDILQAFFNANSANFDARLTNLQESILSLKAVIDSKNTKK